MAIVQGWRAIDEELFAMPNPERLHILTQLRKRAHVSLVQMAHTCGLIGKRGYDSASAWERGLSMPHSSVRFSFRIYLAHTLGLAADLGQFVAVWEILVDEWGWEPLQAADWLVIHGRAAPEAPLVPTAALEEIPDPQLFQPMPTSGSLPAPAPLPPGSLIPLTSNPHFVGRTAELFALAEALKSPPIMANVQTGQVAIVGVGGIGKTQLALEFAHRFGRYFAGGVFWLSFANADAVLSVIAACGGAGGMRLRPDFTQLTLDQQVQLVQAAWEQATPRLLIFDNCEDAELVRRWRPSRGGCRVLITSQQIAWDGALALPIMPLSLLRRAESVQLLRNYFPAPRVSEEILTAISAELDDLPLALHLAGNYLAHGADITPPHRYLADVRAALTSAAPTAAPHPSLAGIGPHGRPLSAPTGHRNHLDQTFALSLGRLDPSDPIEQLARAVLFRAAWFAPGEPIPSNLLLATLPDTVAPTLARNALLRLANTGLLTLHNTGKAEVARLHRLVVSFARRHATDPTAQSDVEQLLLRRLRQLNATDDHPPLLPIQAHLLSVTDEALTTGALVGAELASELSWHLHQVGTTAQTLHYNQRSLAVRSAMLGEQYPDLAINLHTMGWTYDAEGDYPTALAHHQRGLTLRRAAFGDTHRDVASSRNYLGMVLHSLASYQEARQHYQAALAVHLALTPVDQGEVAELRNNMGLLCMAQGRYAEALPHLEVALALREAARPFNGSLLSVTLNNLGYLYRVMGEGGTAQPYLERALALRQAIFGPGNAYVAVTLNHLGRLEHALGNCTAAWHYLEAALRIRQDVFREQHPDTANNLGNLGMLLFDQGDYAAATSYLQAALAMHEALYGDSHRHTARSLNHLGLLHSATGSHHLAEQYFVRALVIRERILGTAHHDTANTLSHVGMLRLADGRISEAHGMLSVALQRHHDGLGSAHPYVARSLLCMGQVCLAIQDQGQARQYLTAAIALYERFFGSAHTFTRRALNVIKGGLDGLS